MRLKGGREGAMARRQTSSGFTPPIPTPLDVRCPPQRKKITLGGKGRGRDGQAGLPVAMEGRLGSPLCLGGPSVGLL